MAIAVLRQISGGGAMLLMWCPGCQLVDEDGEPHRGLHGVNVPAIDGSIREPNWSWDGVLYRPTISPSILIYPSGSQPRCHSFVKQGRWCYLVDCEHSLAGQTVSLPSLPGWVVR